MPRELDEVEKEIAHISHTLSLTPDDDPNLPNLLTSLGAAHEGRYDLLREPNDIGGAIKYTSRALALAPENDPNFPSLLGALGKYHGKRFQRLGEVDDVEKAIEYATRALALTPNGDPKLSDRLGILGVSHHDRFERLDDMDDLEKAIDYDTRALASTPDDNPYFPHRLFSLGASYGTRFQRLGELSDLEKAIEYGSRAVASTPDGDLEMSTRLADLGTSYYDRYKRLGELEDLDKAIEYDSRVLALTPDDHPDLSCCLANLGISHRNRFKLLGELNDIDKAIQYESRALSLTPDGDPGLPVRLANLGVAHRNRYERLDEMTDLEKAIEYQSRAVNMTPDGHPRLSALLANLAHSHSNRFKRLGELSDLDKSIEYDSRALALTPDDHPELSSRLNNLGVAYDDRYEHLSELDDLKKGIDYYSRALAVTPEGHPVLSARHYNLAKLYLHLSRQMRDDSYIKTSLTSFRKSTQSATGNPRIKFKSAFDWAKLASEQSYLHPLEAYQTAIDLLPQFIWLGATTDQRYEDLKTADNLAVEAAAAAIRSSNYKLALEWLEQARCVVWNQSLMLRSPLDQFQIPHPSLATELRTLANQLFTASSETRESRALTSSTIAQEEAAQKHHRLAKEYNKLLNQARSFAGFDGLLKPMSADDIVCAARDGPIVVVACHGDCSGALLILPGQGNITHISLPDFTFEKAQWARSEIDKSLRRKNLRERGVKVRQDSGYKDEFGNALALLWNAIVKPILEHLGYINVVSNDPLPHITWCPTGVVSFLPLHSAGDYDQPQSRVFNYVVSSYTPTVTSLLSSTPSSMSGILAIGMTRTPGHTPLPGTAKELGFIESHAQNTAHYTKLMDGQATTAAVLDAMEQHDWVHLACHAHQNVNDPTKSGFSLHDGILDLAAINRRSFKNKGLAFLSACQTATGDEGLPDEAIHLASGMLVAGYPSVIATMWYVVDEDAPFVADKVYGELMKQGEVGNGEASRALHAAVATLRNKVGEKEFGRWVPYIHIGS